MNGRLVPASTAAHRPEIDGLRAIAVLAVMFYHADIRGFAGGFIGVDVFFVISGFLITRVITAELEVRQFSFTRFYIRRAWRLLPALFTMLAATSIATLLILRPNALYEYAQSLMAVMLFASNLYFWHRTDYFASDARLQPLLHTWSLSAEEQFYFFFPLVLAVLYGFAKNQRWMILAAALVASFACAQWASVAHPPAAFYLLPSRGWELLAGALLCTVPQADKRRGIITTKQRSIVANGFAFAGIILIASSVLIFNDRSPFPGVNAIVPVLGAVLLIAFAGQTTIVGRQLGGRLLVLLGQMSYSTYLWHQPLFALTRSVQGAVLSGWSVTALLGSSLALGYLSWRFVETPLRKPPTLATRPKRVFVGTVIATGLVVFAAIGLASKGYDHAVYRYRFTEEERAVHDLVKRNSATHALDDNGSCRFKRDKIDAIFLSRFEACAKQYQRATVILGDSHAQNLYSALFTADSLTPFLVGVVKVGCRPGDGNLTCPFADFAQFAELHIQQINVVLYNQSGSYLMTDARGRTDSDDIFLESSRLRLDSANMRRTQMYLDTLSGTVPLVWLGPFVEARVNLSSIRSRSDLRISRHVLNVFSELDNAIEQNAAASRHSWQYLSLVAALGIDDSFLLRGNCLTYRDGDHFSACGQAIVGTRLLSVLGRKMPQLNRIPLSAR